MPQKKTTTTKKVVASKKKPIKKTGTKTTTRKKKTLPQKVTVKKTKKTTSVKLLDYSQLERTPFSHQIEAASFLLENKKAILADDMGAGKTFSTILALNSIKGKRIIVCPSTLKLNWKKEIQLVSKDEIHIIEGKKWLKPSRNSWTIINYDILGNHLEDIKKSSYNAVVFDEVHYCKAIDNRGRANSKRARFFLRIANQTEFAFLLTGTPISNKTKWK
jgi:SNF2 family DNA or RNA helicase